MPSRIIPVEPFDYVVFGATGDLARRKLLPALLHRVQDGQIPRGSRIIAVAHDPLDDDSYKAAIRDGLARFAGAVAEDAAIVKQFEDMVNYVRVDVLDNTGWDELQTRLSGRDDFVRAFYLAVRPDLFGPICEQLGSQRLVTTRSRVVIEKPIGHDLESAVRVNDAVGAVFDESQVFRIDHYLGKETVQNLMALRFANALYEPLWNHAHIDHVQITVAEQIGVGKRGSYYDKAGALRDMVQNHLLQLLCLVAMEPPDSYEADAVRDEKLKVLRALCPIENGDVGRDTVRGQYRGLQTEMGSVPSYVEEVGSGRSDTETFVALKAEVANWRWAGVPFYLRTGKRMPERVSEIVVWFKPIPHNIFPERAGALQANKLVIRLQPDEGVMQWIMIKDPGPGGLRLRWVPLDMSFAEAFGVRQPEAYERLLMDVIRGDQTLFMRRDEVEAAWRWVAPILEGWADSGRPPQAYTAGTWGPTRAVALVERDGRTWHEETV
ncbi:MAG: glucose-6-phosphate dehydrogenase [Myxococcota bacterium]|nr:glucose-6-phosphate dehydrogenase [Myxococcota bacterium]